MSYLILSPKLEGFQDGAWTAKLDEATPFDSKDAALDYVRTDIQKDQAAEVVPRFTGCRVVELRKAALASLTRLGLVAREHGDGFAVEVGKADVEKARREWPREVFGFTVLLARNGAILPWGSPKPKDVAVAPWQRNR